MTAERATELKKSADAFRTISEVAGELDVPQHVLRFWETKFMQIRPLKRGGGRRYYRPEDVDLLRGIRRLLYAEGLTIRGVQKVLRERGIRHVMEIGRAVVKARLAVVGGEAGEAALPEPAAPPAAPAAGEAPALASQMGALTGDLERARDEQRLVLTAALGELTDLKTRFDAARAAARKAFRG